MNTQQQNNVPRKGDIIINPLTQRPVKVGGRTWLELTKKGLFEARYTDPKELKQLPEKYEEEYVEEQIQELNKRLPRGQQAVRGRGKYKGKLISRNKQPDTEEVSRYTAKMASKVVNENMESLSECEDLEDELERLILLEMANTTKGKTRITKTKTKPEEEKYNLEEGDLYDEEDEEEDFEDEDIYYE